jgi:hypothetical protein
MSKTDAATRYWAATPSSAQLVGNLYRASPYADETHPPDAGLWKLEMCRHSEQEWEGWRLCKVFGSVADLDEYIRRREGWFLELPLNPPSQPEKKSVR